MSTLNGVPLVELSLGALRDRQHQDETFSELLGWLIVLGVLLWVLWHALKEHRRG